MRDERSLLTSPTLVTGAGGFVGRQFLLLGSSTIRIRAAVRTLAISTKQVESVAVGNIDASTDWSRALIDVESVVHLAAQVHVMNPTPADRAKFETVNVAGTAHLAAAAAQAGVKRFVFLSTVKVNGEMSGQHSFRFDDAPNPGDDYARSKSQAERELARISAASGMEAVFIRAPLVYGPGVRANFLRLMSWAHRGVPLPFASIRNSRSLISVWNLCDLILAALRCPHSINGVLMASDGRDVSTPELIGLLANVLRRPARLFPMPIGLLRTLGRAVGRKDEFDRLCSSLRVDITDTWNKLAWSPPLPLETGLARTASWYLDSLEPGHD